MLPHPPAAEEALHQRLHAFPLKQVGCVFNRPNYPCRRTITIALLAQLSNRSNLALAGATGSNWLASPGTSKRACALFWNANITWNSG